MTIQKIKDYLTEYSYLKSIQALLQWDMETMMPSGAIEDRARRLSYVQGKLHKHITSKKYAALLESFKSAKMKPLEKKLLKELMWDYSLNHAMPLKHVEEISHLQAVASHAWARARKENNWKDFLPHLSQLIALKRREADYFQVKKPYDALLRMHDKEFASTEITSLFSSLKKNLSVIKKEVEKKGRFVKVEDFKVPLKIESQKELGQYVMKLFGLDENFSRLDVSTHPFSINISPKDQRITSRYDVAHLDSLSSTMHEVGHALYEAGLPAEWEGTPFQEAISLSVHESQSRFWENIIGRSSEFSEFIHPRMKKLFPDAMKNVTPEKLFLIMNKSLPGLIRVESCELYYNFHVIIRYEIEEMIFNQGLSTEEIPAIWKEKYRDYLGLTPKTHSEGVLQDSHWAGGAFGYFPTYTLGNLITGHLKKRMEKEMPKMKKDIRNGQMTNIRSWLGENIHSHGRAITTKDIVGEIGTEDYCSYLREKFNG